MPCQCPGNTTILQLLYANLTSECAVGFIEDILGGNFYSFTDVLACEKQKDAWGSNNNLFVGFSTAQKPPVYMISWGRRYTGFRIQRSIIKGVNDFCSAFNRAIPDYTKVSVKKEK